MIIARYQENIGWTSRMESVELEIVQKEVDLPNIGREPSSFLWWIINNYNQINESETYFFVQGSPFDHCPNLFDMVNPVSVFTPLGNWAVTSDATGGPYHFEVPVAEYYNEFIGDFPGILEFCAGGQFAVTGKDLLSHSSNWYSLIYEKLMNDKRPHAPHALERLWPAIFN